MKFVFVILGSYVNPDHLEYFRFIGRVIAMVSELINLYDVFVMT